MDTFQRYRRAWRKARRAYREERARQKRQRPDLRERVAAFGAGVGSLFDALAWGLAWAMCMALIIVPLLALGAPLWFAVGVAFVTGAVATEAESAAP